MSQRVIATIDYANRGEVRIVAGTAELAAEAASMLIDVIEQTHGRIGAVALSGGSTPKLMGALLAEAPLRDTIANSSLHFFWGDERWVPRSNPESNAGEALRGFLELDGVDPHRIHPFQTESVSPEESAKRMSNELLPWSLNGTSLPVLDLVFLGMGDDGHTLSLFPGTAAIHEVQRWVVPNNVPNLNATRLTMTAPVVNAARQVVFLIGGAGKAARLASVLDGPINVDLLPSQIIRPMAGGLIWLVDQAAAANLAKLPEANNG